MRDKLLALRTEIQAMCFYWKQTQKHGHCKEANGANRVCAFCEIVEKIDRILQ